MNIHIDYVDSYPGRCRNCRTVLNGNGESETLRCEDYDRIPHVCHFPPPTPRRAEISGWTNSSFERPAPEPWVKPSERESRAS